MNIVEEEEQLRKADIDITSGRKRIHRQEEIIGELRKDGHDSTAAVELLGVLRETLNAMIEHRALIKKQINRLKNDSGRPGKRPINDIIE